MQIINIIRQFVRKIMRKIAKNLNTVTKGNISQILLVVQKLQPDIRTLLEVQSGYAQAGLRR